MSQTSLNKNFKSHPYHQNPLEILFVTNMYPHANDPGSGAFVMHQAQQLRRLGHRIDILHIFGYRSRLNYLKACFDVSKQTWRKSYDIVHAHYGLSGFPAVFRWRTPLVVTLHGSDALVGKMQPLISRVVCRFANAVIVVSKKIASVIPGEVIPCGVDLEIFKPRNRGEARARLGLPMKQRLILFPFNPQKKVKRYDLAEAVVKRLVSSGQNVELLVVSNVRNDEMPWYYNAADAMILCSDSEGSPTSVKEALACNLPVVSTDVGDMREIMNGVPTTKICEQNVESLAEGLDQLLRQERNSFLQARSAMRQYDQRRTIQSIIAVYQRVLCARN